MNYEDFLFYLTLSHFLKKSVIIYFLDISSSKQLETIKLKHD